MSYLRKGGLDTFQERRGEAAASKVVPAYREVETYRGFVIFERTDVNPSTFWILYDFPITSTPAGLQHVGGHAYASLASVHDTIDLDPDLQKIKQGIRDQKTSQPPRPYYTQ